MNKIDHNRGSSSRGYNGEIDATVEKDSVKWGGHPDNEDYKIEKGIYFLRIKISGYLIGKVNLILKKSSGYKLVEHDWRR